MYFAFIYGHLQFTLTAGLIERGGEERANHICKGTAETNE
jgi:hypothetical protein